MSESTYENIQKNSFVKESIHILNQAYKDKRLVLFVGAGVDHFSDLPLWEKAIEEFCSHLAIKSKNVDNLRIPQYYYNARGKKEYVELSREIFCYNKELLINDVHKKIVDLNVNKVITTNYTDFLEREMDNRGYIYRVICQDKDLAYTKDEKLIIKMHGDFEHDNFVLKEEDYLKYSNNFRLIETYIKAIIAKNLILFIGYSFNDPDIKQLFSWVKDVLGNDFQHAYMLEGYKEYDKNEFEYYRNLGVNTIYIKHFNENPKQALIDVLHIIKLGNMWGLSDVDAVRNNLIPYLNLNYVLERYLNKELSQCNLELRMGILASTVCGGNREKDANKLLSELAERLVKNANILSSDDPYIEIVNALKKSDIRKIGVINEEGKRERIEIPDSKREFWFEQMLNFDYKCLRENVEENDIINNGDEQFYLRQAYIYYILEDYAKSYKALCIAAEKAFYRRQYYVYYIAQFNKYRIKDYMSHDTRVSIRLRDIVKKDVEGIDLDKIILEMPTLPLGNKQILQDIGSFQLHYSLFQDEYRIAERVKKQENNFAIFQNKNPEYMTLQWLIKDYYNYIKYNYLMVDKYIESKEVMVLYIKSFLESVFTPDKTSDIIVEAYNIHASKIGKFEIFLMIKYMSEKELTNMLEQYDIESIPVEDECYSYISTVLNNLRAEKGDSRENELWNCMIIISYINPNYELLESAIDGVSDKFCDFNYRLHKKIIYKLLKVYQRNNDFKNKHKSKCLFKNSALERFLANLLKQAELEEDVSTLKDYSEIIHSTLYIFNSTYGEYYSKDISKLICNTKNLLIAKMYPYCDECNKQLIKQHFEKWEKEISLASCEIYFHIVNNGIIKEKEDYEQQILYYITEKKGQVINGIDFPNDCQDLLVCMYNLYANDKLIQVENFKKVVKEFGDEQLNFFSDMEHFDYNRFKLEWLLSCSDALVKHIANSKNARRNISKKIAEEVENGSISDKYLKLYFKYFIEK